MRKAPTARNVNKLRRISLYGGASAIVIAAYIAFSVVANPYRREVPAGTDEHVALPAVRQYEALDYHTYESILRGNLLFQPPKYLETEGRSQIGKIGKLSLIGLIATGGAFRALIKDEEAGTCNMYSAGQFVGDVLVEEVTSHGVTLRYRENRVKLKR